MNSEASRQEPGPRRRADPSDPAAADLLRLRVAAGLDPAEQVGLPPRLARVVRVARDVGAPLGDALDAGIAAEEDRRQGARAVAVASAQTRVVAGGLLLAPVVLVPLLGRLVGADVAAFYRSPVGGLVLAAGLGALGLGALIVVALVRRVSRPPSAGSPVGRFFLAVLLGVVGWRLFGPVIATVLLTVLAFRARRSSATGAIVGLDEAVDLVATAQAGGVSSSEALRIAADQLPALATDLRTLAFDLDLGERRSFGDPPAAANPRDRLARSDFDRLAEIICSAHDVGAPVAPTLRRLAADLRADDLARVLAAAERLPAQLTFPTALCLLPGTVLLVGAPIVQAGLSAAGT